MEDKPRGIRTIERAGMKKRGSGPRPTNKSANGESTRREGGSEQRRRPPVKRSKRRKGGKRRLIILVIGILILIFLLLTTTFSSARINISLASSAFIVNDVFSATREPVQTGDVTYSIRGPFTETRTSIITNVREEPKFEKASGSVIIYNTNTSGSRLDLVNRTRLVINGKTYRVIGPQKVAGGKTVAGQFEPGSKEVKIEADETGSEFNISDSGVRFSIPGLEKYKDFSSSYAISQTPVIGGHKGTKLIPNENEVATKREELQRAIRNALVAKLNESLKSASFSDRIVFEDSIFITYKELESEQGDNSVTIREEGVLRAVSFREAEFANLLKPFSSSGPDGVTPRAVDSSKLTFSLVSEDSFEPSASKEFNFRINGEGKIYWDIDDPLFLTDFAGKRKGMVKTDIINSYPQVTAVNEVKVFPFWRYSIPSNKSKIELVKQGLKPRESNDSENN